MKKFIFMCVIFAITLTPFFIFAKEYDIDEPGFYIDDLECDTLYYQSASVLVMNADTGCILYETEGFTARYPASVTKVMTALLVLEHVQDLSAPLTFSSHAVDIPYYASRMWVHAGETITVLEALYGNLLPSGNEVARALAEYVSGSVPAFVELMNQRAVELGATTTNFVNPCGLPGDGQFTTAYDMSLIMQAAIQHPVFLQIIATPYFELPPTNMYGNYRTLRNTNRMIRPDEPEYSPYVIGGKTGFTNAAQHTLVSYASRGNHNIILTVLYAPRGANFTDTAALMEYVFNMLDKQEAEEAAKIAAEEELARAMAEAEEVELEKYPPDYALPSATVYDIYEYEEPPDLNLQEYDMYEETPNSRFVAIISISILTAILGLLTAFRYFCRKNNTA